MVSCVSFHFFVHNCILLLFLLLPNVVITVRIGKIWNTTYITSSIDQLLSNLTCSQCTCAALISDGVGWNCVTSDNTCQVISNYSTNDGHLERTNNGNFFFRQFPPQLLLTVADREITSARTTSTTSTRSTTRTTSTSESFLGKCEFTLSLCIYM